MPSEFHINLRETVFALADALDYVGIDELFHGKRVAYMAAECGHQMGLPVEKIDKLIEIGMLHDCGVSSTQTHKNLVTMLDWGGSQEHSLRGAQLLSSTTCLRHLSEAVRYHHTHWSKLEKLHIDDETRLFTNCIFMVDRVDALLAQHKIEGELHSHKAIYQTLEQQSGKMFAPELVDSFRQASRHEAFWLTLDERLAEYLQDWLQRGQSEVLDFPSLRQIASIFSNIVDAKSPFTAEHSLGVANLGRLLGEWFELDVHRCNMIEIAGLFHDLGKLKVPDEILDKPGPLTDEEFQVMKHHSFDSYNILGKISGLEEVARWASDHHETLEGNGYPYGYTKEELPLESRLLAVADIFQALAQSRPYRDGLDVSKIVQRLSILADEGKLDRKVVAMVRENPQACMEAATGHVTEQ